MYADDMNRALDYIEAHLTEDISLRELAGIMRLSVYELRRIFAFIIGLPLSEYIRLRRLSCAVFDLQNGDMTVTELAQRYRYDSPSSFSRAFRDMQGISPSEARKSGALLTTVPRVSLNVSVGSVAGIPFRLEREGGGKLIGYTGISRETEDGCCEDIWDAYFAGGYHDRLLEAGLLGGRFGEYAAYENEGDSFVRCTIGALMGADTPVPEGMTSLEVPPALWGVFEITGAESAQINDAYYRMLSDWLESSAYERDEKVCNLEAFPAEEDGDSDTMVWQIRYPLRPKTTK